MQISAKEENLQHDKIPSEKIFNGGSRNLGLDVARSIAVLLVTFAHFEYFLRPLPKYFYFFGNLSIFAVELFFVLSGFLIGNKLLNLAPRPNSLFSFYKNRWLRTLPLAFAWIFFVYLFFPNEISIYRFLTFSFNFLEYPNFKEKNFLGPMWSLSIEEHFYLFSGVLFYIIAHFQKQRVAFSFSLCILTIAVSAVARAILGDTYDFISMKQTVIFRFDSVAMGLLLALVYQYFPIAWQRLKTMCPLAIFNFIAFWLCISLALQNDFSTTPTLFKSLLFSLIIFYSGFTCAILLPGMTEINIQTVWLTKFIRFVASRSYSIYLVNLFGMYFSEQLNIKYFSFIRQNFAYTITSALFSIFVISEITYQMIEKPFMRLKK